MIDRCFNANRKKRLYHFAVGVTNFDNAFLFNAAENQTAENMSASAVVISIRFMKKINKAKARESAQFQL